MPPRRLLPALLAAVSAVFMLGVGIGFGDQGEEGAETITPAVKRSLEQYRERLADLEARRASPEARAERERSRTAFSDQSRAEARELALGRFGQNLERPRTALQILLDERDGQVVRFNDEYEAVVERRDGAREIEQAQGLPLASDMGSGRLEPVQLGLRETGSGFEPENPVARTRIGRHGAFTLEDARIGVRLSDSAADPVETNGRLFFANALRDTDLVLSPTPVGVQVAFQLRSSDAPESASLAFDLPAGAHLRRATPTGTGVGIPDVEQIEVVKDGDVLATILPPGAWDADGKEFPVTYGVQGARVEVRFPHRDLDLHYPLFVDPDVSQTWGSGGSAWPASSTGGYGGWSWESSGAFNTNVQSGYLTIWNYPNNAFTANTYGQWRWRPASGWTTGAAAFSGIHHAPNGMPMCSRFAMWYGSYEGPYQTYCATWNWQSFTATGSNANNSALYSLIANGGCTQTVCSKSAIAYLLQVVLTIRDNTRPRVTSGAPSPVDWRDPANPGFSWTWAGVDDASGVQRMQLSDAQNSAVLDDQYYSCSFAYPGSCSKTPTGKTLVWPNSKLVEGTNKARVWAQDAAGNWNSDGNAGQLPAPTEFTIRVDRNVPTGINPTLSGGLYDRRGALVQSSQSLSLTVKDDFSGVKWTRFLIDGAVAAGPFNESCGAGFQCNNQTPVTKSVSFNPVTRSDGKHTINPQAEDGLGHQGSYSPFDVLVDNTAPSKPTLQGVPAETWTPGTWTTTATSSDVGTAPTGDWGTGIKTFELLDNGQPIADPRATKQYSCDVTIAGRCQKNPSYDFKYSTAANPPADAIALSAGGHTLSVRASDNAGHSSMSDSWKVNVDNDPPTLEEVSGGLRSFNPTGRDLYVRAAEPADRSGMNEIEFLVDKNQDGDFGSGGPTPDAERQDERLGYQNATCSADANDRTCMELRYALPASFPEGTYKARVIARDRAGNESTDTWKFSVVNMLPGDRSQLGLEDWFDYDSTDAGGDSAVHVNTHTGNLVWHSTPVVDPGRGLSTVVNLTYNSHDRGGLLGSNLGRVPLVDVSGRDLSQELPGLSYGEAGAGFSIAVSGPTRVNEPLGGVQLAEKKDLLSPEAYLAYLRDDLGLQVDDSTTLGDTVTLTDADGTVHTFQRGEGGTWISPAGLDLHLRRYTDDTGDPADEAARWAMTRPDGVTHFFDELGYLRATKDRNGNTLTYVYQPFEAISGTENDARCDALPVAKLTAVAGADLFCIPRLKAVVDPAGSDPLVAGAPVALDQIPQERKLTVEYEPGGLVPGGDFPVQPAIPFPGLTGGKGGRIKTITDHAGRATRFDYDEDGLLRTLTEAAGTAKERVMRFDYEDKTAPVTDPESPQLPAETGIGQDRQMTAVVEVRDGQDYATTAIEHEQRPADPLFTFPGVFKQPRAVRVVTNRRGFERQFAGPSDEGNGVTSMTVDQASGDARGASRHVVHQTDSFGRPTRIEDSVGTTELTWLNENNRLGTLVEAAGSSEDEAVTGMTYNRNGLLATRTEYPSWPSETGARTTTLTYGDKPGVYLARAAASAQDDADGTFVSDLETIDTPKGNTWTFTRDAVTGQITGRSDDKGHTASTTYDTHGRVTREEDELGDVTTYDEHDPIGNPQKVVDPRGNAGEPAAHAWRYTYDAVGNVKTVTDPRGTATADPDDFETTLEYDPFDRLEREVAPKDTDGGADQTIVRKYTYDRNGNLRTDENITTGETTSIDYTKMDMPVSVDRPGGTRDTDGSVANRREVTTYVYDDLDRLVEREDPGEHADLGNPFTEFYVDEHSNQLAQVEHPGSHGEGTQDELITSYAYDGRDNLVGVVDPAGNAGSSADAAITAARSDVSRRASYEYDRVDEMTKSVEHTRGDGVDVVTGYHYDANGNRDVIDPPTGTDITLGYDHRDQLVSRQRQVGDRVERTEYVRADDGKLLAVTSPRGAADSDIGGIDPGRPSAPSCDPAAAGCAPVHTHYTTRFTYDRNGELASRSVPFAPNQYGLSDATLAGWKVTYSRNAVGDPTTVTDARGHDIQNTFFDTGDVRTTTRPSFWKLEWPEQERHEAANPGERFTDAGAEADTQVSTGGPTIAETGGGMADSGGERDLPTASDLAGNFGDVDKQPLPGLLPAAGETTFSYDGEMRLTAIEDKAGDQRKIDYYPGGRVASKTWPFKSDGIVHQFEYDPEGNLTSFTDGEVKKTRFEYDGYDRRTRETAPGAAPEPNHIGSLEETTTYRYDPNGNLTRRTTPRGEGFSFDYHYDSLDRLTGEGNPENERWTYGYDAGGNRTLERPPLGSDVSLEPDAVTEYDVTKHYDAADRLVETDEPEGRVTHLGYDRDGNLDMVDAPGSKPAPDPEPTVTDPNPETPLARQVTETEYDGRGLPWKETAGTGDAVRRTVREFDPNGNLRRVVNGKGVGSNGAPVAVDDGTDSSDNIATATKNATLREYDSDDLLTHVQLPWGERDDEDRKRYTQRFDRDELGRVENIVARHTGGETEVARTSYTYYATGWIKTVSDEQDVPTGSETPVKQHLVDYDYDKRGLQTSWVSTHFGDDSRGRKITRTFWPNGTLASRSATKTLSGADDEQSKRTYRYFYNPNRSLTLMQDDQPELDGEGTRDRDTKFTRDAAERETVVNELWANGKDTRFAYDDDGNVTKRETDGKTTAEGGYVDSATDAHDAKTTRFTYDAMDREETMRVAQGDDATRLVTRSYYPSGQLERKTICRDSSADDCGGANDVIEDHYFDALGDPTRMQRKRRGAADWRKDATYEHDANGNRTKDERGQHEFNARDQLVEWTRGSKYGDTGGSVVGYDLDGTGAIQHKTDQQDPDVTADDTETQFTYDGSRLQKTRDSKDGVAQQETTYSYDDFGSVVKAKTELLVDNTVLPPVNQLAGLPDACGEMDTDRRTTQYCYDEFERLVATKGPMTADQAAEASVYAYDGLDRRTQRTVKKDGEGDLTGDMAYVGASRMLSREKDAKSGKTKYYDYDSRGEREGISKSASDSVDPTEHQDYALDANGSVEQLEGSDGDAVSGSDYLYDPYGESENPDSGDGALSAQAEDNPFRFEGFYLDSGVKTYDMQAREYRPDVGRFLSQDRFESAAGDLNLQADPLTQNRYAFAGGNPVNRVEFDGHCADAGDYLTCGFGKTRRTVHKGASHNVDEHGNPVDSAPAANRKNPYVPRPPADPPKVATPEQNALATRITQSPAYGELWDPKPDTATLSQFAPQWLWARLDELAAEEDRLESREGSWEATVALLAQIGACSRYGGCAPGVPLRLSSTSRAPSTAARPVARGADEAFHYTRGRFVEAIEKEGLRPGTYVASRGDLSPLQAQIDLALPPNRGLSDAIVRVDLAGLRKAGYDMGGFTPVGRKFNMPGGGTELRLERAVPPRFLRVTRR